MWEDLEIHQGMKKNCTKAGCGFDNIDLFEEELSQTSLFQTSVPKANLSFSFSISKLLL